MKIVYEWNIETIDSEGKAWKNDYKFSLADLGSPREVLAVNTKLCLIRNELDDGSPELDSHVNKKSRSYLDGSAINEFFQTNDGKDGERVPVRFHTELSKWLKS